jgi:carbon storage regulator
MLVLSRKVGESIVINENIVVTVVDMDYKKVRIGVTAPKEVTINRQEVQDAINRKGGKSADDQQTEG